MSDVGMAGGGLDRSIRVTFARHGFHNWPEAEGTRSYLAQRHRHLFHVSVELETFHDDREVEFHDLQDWCVRTWDQIGVEHQKSVGKELGRRSCEEVALYFIYKLTRQFGGRRVSVEVTEDEDVGARLTWTPSR